MSRKSIMIGATAAALSGGGCLAVLVWKPMGNLQVSQWWILASSMGVGLGLAFLRTGSPNEVSRLNARACCVVCLLAAGVVIASAWVVDRPLLWGLARESLTLLEYDCETLIHDWPSDPGAADFRKLEWSLRAAEHGVRGLDQRRKSLGLVEPDHVRALGRALRPDGWPGAEDLAILSTGHLPVGREDQYQRMGTRVQAAAHGLVTASEETDLAELIDWSRNIERAVSTLGMSDLPKNDAMADEVGNPLNDPLP